MEYPYKLYDAYINIDDIKIEKVGNVEDCTPTHLQALLEKAVTKGIEKGLSALGIAEYIPTVATHVSVYPHEDGWIPCVQNLPPYDETVLICLEDDSTRVMTHRTRNDYSKDKYDFLHVSVARDAKYWQPLPPSPKNIKRNHRLTEPK